MSGLFRRLHRRGGGKHDDDSTVRAAYAAADRAAKAAKDGDYHAARKEAADAKAADPDGALDAALVARQGADQIRYVHLAAAKIVDGEIVGHLRDAAKRHSDPALERCADNLAKHAESVASAAAASASASLDAASHMSAAYFSAARRALDPLAEPPVELAAIADNNCTAPDPDGARKAMALSVQAIQDAQAASVAAADKLAGETCAAIRDAAKRHSDPFLSRDADYLAADVDSMHNSLASGRVRVHDGIAALGTAHFKAAKRALATAAAADDAAKEEAGPNA